MSALTRKADLEGRFRNVRYGPIADICFARNHRAIHSGLLDPRGTRTVLNEPGVRDMTTWSVSPWYVPNGVSAVNKSGATYECSSDDPAVACA